MKMIILLIVLLATCSSSRVQRKSTEPDAQNKSELKLIIPKATWEPIFFESINERTQIAKLPKLRTVILPKDDLEIRVWGGFGLTALEGFIIKRSQGQWSAMHLEGIHPKLPRNQYQKSLQSPKSGWEACWKRLVEAGILELPDSSDLQGEVSVEDGFSYVVEINMNGNYRTYMYANPNYQKWNEAKQMMKIGDIISEEFNLPEFSIKQ